jgi:hypothetical protein
LDANTGYFALADISGYTGYLANNELEHARGIISEITNLLIGELRAPFRFVELEGDAVFVFAPSAAVEDAERLIDILEASYASFRLLQEQMVKNTSCTCNACRAIKDLDLKCVAHFGEYAPQHTPNGTKLLGKDVILVHRLLKNSVIQETGIKAYAFLSDAFVGRVASANLGRSAPAHTERYEELGAVTGRVLNLADAVSRYTGAARFYVESKDADFELVTDLPAPRSVVWAYHIDASRRLKWQLDTVSVENRPGEDGRTGIGTSSYCDHGNYRLNHRIVDWRPFDYSTMDTVPEGTALVKPPPGLATFDFEELDGGRTRVSMRIRLHERGILTLMMLMILRPLIRKQWRGHYAALDRLIREDLARSGQAAD